ncbi:MAG: hypothetical protein NTY03_13785 [Candidatus Bathyarchaeota archaeon]|nr:hypothetical protein [Candidatus Bathyarchaeota archaeon]
MKPLVILAALLLISGLVVPSMVLALDLPRHMDPAQLPDENPDAGKLFKLYYIIFHETARENFTGASEWLQWALKVDALANLNTTLSSYSELTGNELRLLNQTRAIIDEAQRTLLMMDSKTIYTILRDGLAELGRANQTLNSIDSTSKTLGTILGYSTQQLDQGVYEIRLLIAKYLDLLGLLRARAIVVDIQSGNVVNGTDRDWLINHYPDVAQDFEKGHPGKSFDEIVDYYRQNPLTRPRLIIWTDRSWAWVGSNVTVSGELTDYNAGPISNRTIIIKIDGVTPGEVNTDSSGGLTKNVTIPYVYKANVTIVAEYQPRGADASRWAASTSNGVVIGLFYYAPKLLVDVPVEAYPGKVMRISGSLSSESVGLPGFRVSIRVFGETMSIETSQNGLFSLDVPVPGDYPEGYTDVAFDSEGRGLYAPATATLYVDIVRFPSTIYVSSPRWIFSGTKLSVIGRIVTPNSPLSGCALELKSDIGSNSTRTAGDGSFEASVNLPSTILTSSYTYSVFSSPSPWIRPSAATGSVLVINLFTVLSIPVLLGAAAILAAKRIRWRPRPISLEAKPVLRDANPPDAMPGIPIEEPKGIRSIFIRLVSVVAAKLGLVLGKSQTIREWLKDVGSKLDKPVLSLVESLSLAYERWLYDAPAKSNDRLARVLYGMLKEFLG